MSLGRSIPYHLRQNKAVDRYVFLDLLNKIAKFSDIESYAYIGFGGHSLEDFKHVHSQFGIEKMISIEQDKEVHSRQLFNRPHNCIDCQRINSSDFIKSFSEIKARAEIDKVIIWLDYVQPGMLKEQIDEFRSLVDDLEVLDIIKVTLNAEPSSYAPESKMSEDIRDAVNRGDIDAKNNERIRLLKELLSESFPMMTINKEMMSYKSFPTALCKVLEMASDLATSDRSDVYLQPLTSFSYADGQQMLTITGILLQKGMMDEFSVKTGIQNWALCNLEWERPICINIPDFTVRERLQIDAMLPIAEAEDIQRSLGFSFGRNEVDSLKMLKNYVLFYRQSPYFSKVFI